MSVRNPRIASLIDSWVSTRQHVARVVSLADEIVELLKADQLLYTMRIPPWMVGAHPANRGGYGCSGMMVHSLGADIVQMGWSNEAIAHALCVEDDDSAKVVKETRSLIESSPGLAPVPAEHIKYGSLSCTHTNQFLNAVNYGIASDEESLTVEGRISKSKLEEDAKLKEALEKGLLWTVLSKQVEALYGQEVLDLLSHARNRTGAAQVKDGEIQVLLKVQKMVSRFSMVGQVDWESISRCLVKRESMDPKDLQVLMKFVQLYGGWYTGGIHPRSQPLPQKLCGEWSHRAHLHVQCHQRVEDFTFGVVPLVCHCDRKSTGSMPCCQDSEQNVQVHHAIGHLWLELCGQKKQMLQAEDVLVQCRSIVDLHGQGLDEKLRYKMIARLDTMVARIVLKKDTTQHSSVEHAGHGFCMDLAKALQDIGKQSPIVSPWAELVSKSSAAKEQAKEQTPSQGLNVIEYDASGRAVGACRLSLESRGCQQHRVHIGSTLESCCWS